MNLEHAGAIQKTAQAYFGLCEAIDFAALETALANVSSEDPWERARRASWPRIWASRGSQLAEYLLGYTGADAAISII